LADVSDNALRPSEGECDGGHRNLPLAALKEYTHITIDRGANHNALSELRVFDSLSWSYSINGKFGNRRHQEIRWR